MRVESYNISACVESEVLGTYMWEWFSFGIVEFVLVGG